MTRLTEEMVVTRAKESDLSVITKFNCWGSDLSDVSIVRRMHSIEILALSVNNIATLAPFEDCHKLQELYLRKNKISSIKEVVFLQNLPKLRYLWLEENPLCHEAGRNYRAIILRLLPNLKKLDNVEVTQEELDNALRGRDKEEMDASPQQVQQQQQQQPCSSSPIREEPVHPPSPKPKTVTKEHQTSHHQNDRSPGSDQESPNAVYREVRPSPPPRSKSIHSMKEDNQSDRPAYPAHYGDSQTDQTEWEEHQQHSRNQYDTQMHLNHHQNQRRIAGSARYGSARENRGNWEPEESQRARRAEVRRNSVSSASTNVMNRYAGYHRRSANRNANVLSATLSLVQELDYTSLEVLEHVVRCRRDEFRNEAEYY